MPPASTSTSAREETRRNQAAAADPTASAWVSANAGTGKTHVLTLRMLRLLLAGTEPARILGAAQPGQGAAAEMATRVFARLADWVTAGDEALPTALRELLDRLRSAGGDAPRPPTVRAGDRDARRPQGADHPRLLRAAVHSASPWRPACRPASRSSTITPATRCWPRPPTRSSPRLPRAAPGTPLGDALKRTIAYTAESSFDDLLADALRHRDWLNAQLTPALQVLGYALRYREWLEEVRRLDVAGDGLRLEEAEESIAGRCAGCQP